MQNISNASRAEVQNLPEVEVLLATFNGAAFLQEFLASLSSQVGVKIHLSVSDDGSTDSTLKIVDSHKHKFESFKILNGPRTGPASNFFHLINQATQGFVALADQDDVWLPNHLVDSINRLIPTQELPSLTFSSVLEFENNQNREKLWPIRFPGDDIRTVLTENLARGCTFVLNSAAINLINMHKPKNAIMHDWWILLLIFSSGRVTWSTNPEVRYRLHQNNSVGGKPNLKIRSNRFFKNFRSRDLSTVRQADELLSNFSWSMSSQKRYEIGSFLRDIYSPLLTGRWNLLLWRNRFRSSYVDELAVRVAFVVQRRKKKGVGTLGILIYHRFRQLIARFSFFVATLKQRLKTFIDYRVTKRFEQYRVLKKFERVSPSGVAVVALYPRTGIQESVMRLIDSLVDSNYSVIIVMNESHLADDWFVSLSKKPVEILRRPNIGRDFGAYKIGFIHAEKNGYLKNTENLLFANDSVLYGPRSNAFVQSMLKMKRPWHAMFVNYQFHTHAQSFFQVFEGNIFRSKAFAEFWHKYYPSELRHHAINNGEAGLSAICLALGFAPESYVNASSILNDVKFGDFTPDEKFGIWSNHGLTYLNQEISSFENTSFLMKRQYLENNVTHHQGLLASRVLNAPLKLDIFQTGQATIQGIEESLVALGFNDDELRQVLRVMTLKGTHASRKGFNRLWGSYGYV
jgi:glycosyltransferase involved in cell wall biosynthesis